MPNRRRGGRPWGALQAQTPEAEALALFLRAQIDASPLTMTAVAKMINYSKTQTGQYLSGRVPERDFVTAVIRVTVPEPQLRERRQAEADRLLAAANKPAPSAGRAVGSGAADELERVRAQQVDTYERLTRSLEQQAALQEAARNSAQLVMVLMTMISTLESRVQGLTAERDQLLGRGGDGRELEDTQHQLARALDQERRAQEELTRARDKQQQAEELAGRVQAQVWELTDELDRLRVGTAYTGDEPPTDPDTAQRSGPGSAAPDPVGDDIEQALARASTVNDTDDQTLQRITHELHDDQHHQAGTRGTALRGHQAPAQAGVVPDNRDNPAAGTATPAAGPRAKTYRSVREYANAIFSLTTLHGPDHRETLAAQAQHARYVGETGDAAEAARLYAGLSSDLVHVLGANHQETLTARAYHAHYIGQSGYPAEAARLYGNLVPALEHVLGPDHQETLTARVHHARYIGQSGNTAKAARLYDNLVLDLTRALGPDHRDTLTARTYHAHYIGQSGDTTEAARLYDNLVLDLTRALGPDHRDTLTARTYLANYARRRKA